MALSLPLLSGLHSGVTSPLFVPVQEDECHKQEQRHYHDRHDHHLVVGHGLWGEKGERSQKSSGPRCQAPEGPLSTCHPPTHPGQPAVTLHCRDEWQMVLSLEGRRTGSRPPAGLCETVGHMDSDGPLDMRCQNSWSALWRGPGQAPPWAEMRELQPNSLKTKKILAI